MRGGKKGGTAAPSDKEDARTADSLRHGRPPEGRTQSRPGGRLLRFGRSNAPSARHAFFSQTVSYAVFPCRRARQDGSPSPARKIVHGRRTSCGSGAFAPRRPFCHGGRPYGQRDGRRSPRMVSMASQGVRRYAVNKRHCTCSKKESKGKGENPPSTAAPSLRARSFPSRRPRREPSRQSSMPGPLPFENLESRASSPARNRR